MSRAAVQAGLGPRAARTRQAIVDTARGLFLDRGYEGTSVVDITEACGISRAGFYTYFRHKREIFAELGRASYRSTRGVVDRLADLPDQWTAADVEAWIREYFAHMDIHGAFVLAAALSAPREAEFRADSRRTQLRVAGTVGTELGRRHGRPLGAAPETVGVVVLALLERCWYQLRVTDAPVEEADLVSEAAAMIVGFAGT